MTDNELVAKEFKQLKSIAEINRDVMHELIFTNRLEHYNKLKEKVHRPDIWKIEEEAGHDWIEMSKFRPTTADDSVHFREDYTTENWREILSYTRNKYMDLHFRYYRLCAAQNIFDDGVTTKLEDVERLINGTLAKKDQESKGVHPIVAGAVGFAIALLLKGMLWHCQKNKITSKVNKQEQIKQNESTTEKFQYVGFVGRIQWKSEH